MSWFGAKLYSADFLGADLAGEALASSIVCLGRDEARYTWHPELGNGYVDDGEPPLPLKKLPSP